MIYETVGGDACAEAQPAVGRKQAAPPALVWFWRLEEDRTEETRQTVKAAGVLNNLN